MFGLQTCQLGLNVRLKAKLEKEIEEKRKLKQIQKLKNIVEKVTFPNIQMNIIYESYLHSKLYLREVFKALKGETLQEKKLEDLHAGSSFAKLHLQRVCLRALRQTLVKQSMAHFRINSMASRMLQARAFQFLETKKRLLNAAAILCA